MQREDTYAIDPESALEMIRLIEQDRIVTKGMGGVFPEYGNKLPEDVKHILDVGCGSGGWVLDVAHLHPDCEVVGLDVSTTLLNYARARAKVLERRNAVFVQGNVLKPLEFVDAEFDLVNIRFAGAFLLRDAWVPVLRELFRVMRPGGIIRLTEGDVMGVTTSLAIEKLLGYLSQTLKVMGYGFSPDGKNLGLTPVLKGLLIASGFQDIKLFPYVIDLSFDAELYQNLYDNYVVSCSIIRPLIERYQVTSQEEFEDVVNRLQIEMRQEDFQGIWNLLTARGIKLA